MKCQDHDSVLNNTSLLWLWEHLIFSDSALNSRQHTKGCKHTMCNTLVCLALLTNHMYHKAAQLIQCFQLNHHYG